MDFEAVLGGIGATVVILLCILSVVFVTSYHPVSRDQYQCTALTAQGECYQYTRKEPVR